MNDSKSRRDHEVKMRLRRGWNKDVPPLEFAIVVVPPLLAEEECGRETFLKFLRSGEFFCVPLVMATFNTDTKEMRESFPEIAGDVALAHVFAVRGEEMVHIAATFRAMGLLVATDKEAVRVAHLLFKEFLDQIKTGP